jgi:hypothetical protein
MARITRALGKKREKKEETKQMSLRVPTELSDMFDQYAEEDESTVTQIGLEAFQQYVEQRNRDTRLIEEAVNETYDLLANGEFDTVLAARLGVIMANDKKIATFITNQVRTALQSEDMVTALTQPTSVSDEQVAAIVDRVIDLIQPPEEPEPRAAEKPVARAPVEPVPRAAEKPPKPSSAEPSSLRKPDEMVAFTEEDLAAAGVSLDDLESAEPEEDPRASRRRTGKGTSRTSIKARS